jgi:hypothetical protein
MCGEQRKCGQCGEKGAHPKMLVSNAVVVLLQIGESLASYASVKRILNRFQRWGRGNRPTVKLGQS